MLLFTFVATTTTTTTIAWEHWIKMFNLLLFYTGFWWFFLFREIFREKRSLFREFFSLFLNRAQAKLSLKTYNLIVIWFIFLIYFCFCCWSIINQWKIENYERKKRKKSTSNTIIHFLISIKWETKKKEWSFFLMTNNIRAQTTYIVRNTCCCFTCCSQYYYRFAWLLNSF